MQTPVSVVSPSNPNVEFEAIVGADTDEAPNQEKKKKKKKKKRVESDEDQFIRHAKEVEDQEWKL